MSKTGNKYLKVTKEFYNSIRILAGCDARGGYNYHLLNDLVRFDEDDMNWYKLHNSFDQVLFDGFILYITNEKGFENYLMYDDSSTRLLSETTISSKCIPINPSVIIKSNITIEDILAEKESKNKGMDLLLIEVNKELFKLISFDDGINPLNPHGFIIDNSEKVQIKKSIWYKLKFYDRDVIYNGHLVYVCPLPFYTNYLLFDNNSKYIEKKSDIFELDQKYIISIETKNVLKYLEQHIPFIKKELDLTLVDMVNRKNVGPNYHHQNMELKHVLNTIMNDLHVYPPLIKNPTYNPKVDIKAYMDSEDNNTMTIRIPKDRLREGLYHFEIKIGYDPEYIKLNDHLLF